MHGERNNGVRAVLFLDVVAQPSGERATSAAVEKSVLILPARRSVSAGGIFVTAPTEAILVRIRLRSYALRVRSV